jgi:hypothetical protein
VIAVGELDGVGAVEPDDRDVVAAALGPALVVEAALQPRDPPWRALRRVVLVVVRVVRARRERQPRPVGCPHRRFDGLPEPGELA